MLKLSNQWNQSNFCQNYFIAVGEVVFPKQLFVCCNSQQALSNLGAELHRVVYLTLFKSDFWPKHDPRGAQRKWYEPQQEKYKEVCCTYYIIHMGFIWRRSRATVCSYLVSKALQRNIVLILRRPSLSEMYQVAKR